MKYVLFLGVANSARSQMAEAIPLDRVDTVVTLCTDEVCPHRPGTLERHHWPIPDPAAVTGSDEEQRGAFRNARDETSRRLEGLVNSR